MDRIKVLYIGGYSRSGSTLLLRAIGEAHGVVAVGELINIWSRGYVENQLCGCGEPFRKCDFWNEVSQETFGLTSDDVPGQAMFELQQAVHGYAAFPKLWIPSLRTASYRRDFQRYAGIIGDLYAAICKVSGARLVVDSSKLPQFARMLSEVDTVDMHLTHLVRDSRGTAFSWRRPKVMTEIHWKRQEMDRHSLMRSAVEWSAFNFLLGTDRRRPASYTLLRYEDLVRSPGAELEALAHGMGEDGIATELQGTGSDVALRMSHTVAGNPSRFDAGKTRIAADEEWRTAMPAGQRILVTAVTAPMLRRHGYRLRSSPPSGS